MTKCQCSPDCQAIVKTKGKMYAQGHNPTSAWLTGKTKLTDPSVAKIAAAVTGKIVGRATRKKLAVASRQRWSDPLEREKQSEKQKSTWDERSPDDRKRIIDTMVYSERRTEFINSPENKQHLSEQVKNNWADPKIRPKLEAERKQRGNTPEERARLSAIAKALWEGERGKRMRAERHKRWANPTYKAKMKSVFKQSVVWNKGKTKATHPSLSALSKRFKGRIPKRGFRIKYEGPCGQHTMRSSWEWVYAQYLDDQGINWLYEKWHFDVGVGPWKGTTYTPDFFLIKTQTFIDVKGHLSAANHARVDMFQKLNPATKLQLFWQADFLAVGIDVRAIESKIRKLVRAGTPPVHYTECM